MYFNGGIPNAIKIIITMFIPPLLSLLNLVCGDRLYYMKV
jgi:hypothetical protein